MLRLRSLIQSTNNTRCLFPLSNLYDEHLRSLHTSAALDTKRHIVLQRRRRKRLRLKKINNRFADVSQLQREQKERWTKERKAADLEQVWRENGLTEEPPILSVDKKRELMVRWFQEGKLYSVMGHDELVDYNLNIPIQVAPDKLQPKCWYMDEKTPRHSHQIHFSDDIKKRAPKIKLKQNRIKSGTEDIVDEMNAKFASTDLNDKK